MQTSVENLKKDINKYVKSGIIGKIRAIFVNAILINIVDSFWVKNDSYIVRVEAVPTGTPVSFPYAIGEAANGTGYALHVVPLDSSGNFVLFRITDRSNTGFKIYPVSNATVEVQVFKI